MMALDGRTVPAAPNPEPFAGSVCGRGTVGQQRAVGTKCGSLHTLLCAVAEPEPMIIGVGATWALPITGQREQGEVQVQGGASTAGTHAGHKVCTSIGIGCISIGIRRAGPCQGARLERGCELA